MSRQEDGLAEHSHQDRDDLLKLLDYAQSESVENKRKAAEELPRYMLKVPEMQDDLVNAVYDLCEDTSAEIRVEGYKAIVAVSKEDKETLKRNVDVLVQLLQCDDPEEIIHIREGLEQHLAIDPSVTMAVLCDQLSWTEDEQGNREQLRTLVLEFLARSIRPLNVAIIRSSDKILVDGILEALPSAPPSDVRIMIKDILLALPAFKSRTDRGDETLVKLLAMTQASFVAEMSASSKALSDTLSLLDAAHLWVVSSARPLSLFRFYFNTIVNDINNFEIRTQVAVVCNIAKMLQVYLDNPMLHDTPAALKQATDRSIPLLKILVDSKPEEEETWKACRTFLEAFLTRRTYRENDWPELEIPEDAKSGIRELDRLAESQRLEKMDSDYLQAVQDTIRNLLATPTGGPYRRSGKRKYESDRHYRGLDPSTAGQRRLDRFERGHGSDGSGPTEGRRSRSPKRSRLRDERRDGEHQPSLLSRLEVSSGLLPGSSSQREDSVFASGKTTLPPSLPQKPVSNVALPSDRDKDPVRGFTIKGAARGDSETDGRKRTVDRDGSAESLLGRMDERRGGRRRDPR
ncbi:apoptosis inhibitory protein 5-domain-containing protein [Thelephora terrestris]|uniref:Apoptosis inhibitory protein 5-domain-containing protein n=1 Tax=Thelephora terrestris TaxID=56493 RepID=A0A9P6LC77_9AGAM|nr:apoptosis inhibitory protein 5-domain-containing protein [Thelephora terrestris]